MAELATGQLDVGITFEDIAWDIGVRFFGDVDVEDTGGSPVHGGCVGLGGGGVGYIGGTRNSTCGQIVFTLYSTEFDM